jgi:hypothetical protein
MDAYILYHIQCFERMCIHKFKNLEGKFMFTLNISLGSYVTCIGKKYITSSRACINRDVEPE